MKEVIPDYDKYYLWGHEIEDGTWPDFSSTNVGYIERNLVNRLYNLKVSLENTVSYLSHCFPIFTVTAFNLHKSSVRWVGWVELSFWPPEGRWRCWVRPRQDCPGNTGSFADQGTSALGSQFGWHQLLGSDSRRAKRLQRASASPAVPPPSADSCPRSALECQLLSGKCDGRRRVGSQGLWLCGVSVIWVWTPRPYLTVIDCRQSLWASFSFIWRVGMLWFIPRGSPTIIYSNKGVSKKMLWIF